MWPCYRVLSPMVLVVALAFMSIVGFASSAVAQSEGGTSEQLVCQDVTTTGEFTLAFTGVDYDAGAITSTWNYRLQWTTPGSGPLHLTIGVCGTLNGGEPISTVPEGGVLTFDTSTGIYGINWSGLEVDSPTDFSFTVHGTFGIGTVNIAAGFGTGQNGSTICGMTCEQVCVIGIDCPPDATLDCSADTDPSNTGDQVITAVDTTPPSITCPDTVRVPCGEQLPAPTPGLVQAYDNCGPVTITYRGDSVGDGPLSGDAVLDVIYRTYRAADERGDFAECQQVLLLGVDDTPPRMECAGDLVLECGATVQDIESPLIYDTCDPQPEVEFADVVKRGQRCPQDMRIIRTWTATDASGNSTTCMQTITTLDTTPPVISGPDTLSVTCVDGLPEPYADGVEAMDNCGEATLNHIADFDPNGAIDTGRPDDPSRTGCAEYVGRKYEAFDECGNRSARVFIIAMVDDIPPTIACPGSLFVSCGEEIPPADPTLVEASDDCGGQVTVVHVGDESIYPKIRLRQDTLEDSPVVNGEVILRTYRATDACGNSSSCVQYITAGDTEGPVIECGKYGDDDDSGYTTDDCGGGGVIIYVECDSLDYLVPPVVTDNCDPNPSLVYKDFEIKGNCPVECPVIHEFRRKWHAHDYYGNSAVCWWRVKVTDRTPPVLTCAPDMSIPCGAQVEFTPPDVGDNCDTSVDVVSAGPWVEPGPGPGDVTHVMCWSAEDDCGNTSECCQRITVLSCDQQQPCTFTMWEWGACCFAEEAGNLGSTYPACVRDRYFSDVFPNGVLVGDPSGIGGGDPNAYAALWTTARAIMDYLPAFGESGPLSGDLINPNTTPSGFLCGQILTLRLNREYSCAGILGDLCFTDGTVCLGEYVVPSSCSLIFEGLTVDELLALGDQAISGNLAALDQYGASLLDLKSAVQCLNYELSGCDPDCDAPTVSLAIDSEGGDDGRIGLGESGLGATPKQFVVYQSFPNPFAGQTNIRFGLPADGRVTVQVFNAMGRKVATVIDEHRSPGFHSVIWNGCDDRGYMMPSGVYFYMVKHGTETDVKKMILSR